MQHRLFCCFNKLVLSLKVHYQYIWKPIWVHDFLSDNDFSTKNLFQSVLILCRHSCKFWANFCALWIFLLKSILLRYIELEYLESLEKMCSDRKTWVNTIDNIMNLTRRWKCNDDELRYRKYWLGLWDIQLNVCIQHVKVHLQKKCKQLHMNWLCVCSFFDCWDT